MNTLDFGEIMEQDCWFENYDLSCPYCHGDPDEPSFDALSKDEQREVLAVQVCAENEGFGAWLLEDDNAIVDGYGDKITADDLPSYSTEEMIKAVEAYVDLFPKDDYLDEEEMAEWFDENRTEFDFRCEECSEGMFEVMWNTAFGVCLPYKPDFDYLNKLAWDMGFCLIDHNGEHYLLMGSCGQDNTWRVHYTRWLVQNKWLEKEDRDRVIGNWGAHVFLNGDAKREFMDYLRSNVAFPDEAVRSVLRSHEELDRIERDMEKSSDRWPSGMLRDLGYLNKKSTYRYVYHLTWNGGIPDKPGSIEILFPTGTNFCDTHFRVVNVSGDTDSESPITVVLMKHDDPHFYVDPRVLRNDFCKKWGYDEKVKFTVTRHLIVDIQDTTELPKEK